MACTRRKIALMKVVRLYPRFDKLGGNGPIMANALLAAGVEVTYAGALGTPEVHPVFAELARRGRVHSLCAPAHTTAVEFSDGKLMLGVMRSLDEVTFQQLTSKIGLEGLRTELASASLVALVNWTMIPHMSAILESLANEVLPTLPADRQRVCFFDLADPEKRTREDLARVLRETRAREVIIAMPSATGAVRRDIVERCRAADVRVTTVPGLPELINGEVSVQKLREVQVEDVLGRAPVEIDMARVARYLNGKRVLVTGAGGSIGSDLCRQLAQVGPSSLVIVDHAENNLFEIDMELRERGHAPVPVVADCRNGVLMDQVFTQYRPEIVFHAAAYKHVSMAEMAVCAAARVNVLGTAEVLAALQETDARFVLVSSDKAASPRGVMGATKRLAELVTLATPSATAVTPMVVRFGNVLASSGSFVDGLL